MTNTQQLRSGQRLDHVRGSQVLRVVEVVSIDGDRIEVRALFGSMAGMTYKVDRSELVVR